MPTIPEIKQEVDENIRQKTLPNSITRTNDAAIRDKILDEIKVRGFIHVASTGELDEHSHNDTAGIFVYDVGLFVAEESSDPVDDVITFESADEGWIWRKRVDSSDGGGADRFTLTEDGTYTLLEGYQIRQINGKPSTEQTQSWGLTDGGQEIMEETVLPAGVTKPVQMVIIAEGGDVTLYFTGITASTAFTIYKDKL